MVYDYGVEYNPTIPINFRVRDSQLVVCVVLAQHIHEHRPKRQEHIEELVLQHASHFLSRRWLRLP